MKNAVIVHSELCTTMVRDGWLGRGPNVAPFATKVTIAKGQTRMGTVLETVS